MAGRITGTVRILAWLGCGGGSERFAGWTVCLGAGIRHSGTGLGSRTRMRLGLSSRDVDPTPWCGGRRGRSRGRGEGASLTGGKSVSEGGPGADIPAPQGWCRLSCSVAYRRLPSQRLAAELSLRPTRISASYHKIPTWNTAHLALASQLTSQMSPFLRGIEG